MAARLQDIDPQAVELQLAPAQVEGAFLGEARDILEQLDDADLLEEIEQSCWALAEDDRAGRRWSKGIAAIAMLLRPAPPGAIVLGQRPAALLDLLEQVGIDPLSDLLGAVAAEAHWLAEGDDVRFVNDVALRLSEA
jgi:hypothetical protein